MTKKELNSLHYEWSTTRNFKPEALTDAMAYRAGWIRAVKTLVALGIRDGCTLSYLIPQESVERLLVEDVDPLPEIQD